MIWKYLLLKFFCCCGSPHNPTGKVFSSTELAAIAALCCKYDCLAISDEVFYTSALFLDGHNNQFAKPEKFARNPSVTKTPWNPQKMKYS